MKHIKSITALLCLASITPVIAGDVAIKNGTNEDLLLEVTSTWCHTWGNPGEQALMHFGNYLGVTLPSAVNALATAAAKKGVDLKVRPCTNGDSTKDRHLVRAGESLTIGKVGVWYDIKIINQDGTEISPTSPVRLQGKQMELYRSVHIPADQSWDLRAVNLDSLGYAGKYGENIGK